MNKRILYQIGICILAALLSACSDPRLQKAQSLLAPSTFNVKVQSYCPENGFTLKEVFAINTSARIERQLWRGDSDRDGLTDEFELTQQNRDWYGITATNADTNLDGYSDLLMAGMGMTDTAQLSLRLCATTYQDTDYDALTDCDELILGTDILNPDTDGDGILDGLELRFGLNPSDPVDGARDADSDYLSALEEVKRNTPVDESNTTQINSLGLIYHLETASSEDGTRSDCYNITVDRFPLIPVSNGNLVEFYALEKKIVIGQGDVIRSRKVTLLVPQDTGFNVTYLLHGIHEQVVDGILLPWEVVE